MCAPLHQRLSLGHISLLVRLHRGCGYLSLIWLQINRAAMGACYRRRGRKKNIWVSFKCWYRFQIPWLCRAAKRVDRACKLRNFYYFYVDFGFVFYFAYRLLDTAACFRIVHAATNFIGIKQFIPHGCRFPTYKWNKLQNNKYSEPTRTYSKRETRKNEPNNERMHGCHCWYPPRSNWLETSCIFVNTSWTSESWKL